MQASGITEKTVGKMAIRLAICCSICPCCAICATGLLAASLKYS